jgi:hypothetical protein
MSPIVLDATLDTHVLTETTCIENLSAASTRPGRGVERTEGTVAMPQLPSHQDTGPGVPEVPIAARSQRRKVSIVLVVVALVLLAAVLHLTGVLGAEGH